MDPLSLSASIVGLLTAASSVASVLLKVKSSISDAPQSMHHALSQVTELRVVLSAIDRLVSGMVVPRNGRLGMIQVDQLVATVTEAVMTISELEAVTEPLSKGSKESILTRIKWAWNENAISSILLRLDRHKSSFSLMLNIAQW
jgi:type II secretory pathway component PulJ